MHTLALENSYITLPDIFYKHVKPCGFAKPQLVIFNQSLACALGLSLNGDDEEDLAHLFSGNYFATSNHVTIAQAYAGHQFGHFTMLGDGRAHLLGEHLTPDGKRYDLQLKGSGQTPYSRRGDGKAALAPMLREYLISEAMHALGIPTTRSLAVVTTGENVMRDSALTGAVLTRVAASHIRVGTFQFAAMQENPAFIKALADYTINRHYPALSQHEQKYEAFLNNMIEKQAHLIASWLQVGFVHGVMNTDNMTISGETIDYGPCAFMDRFSFDTVFSSIDHHGRYAYKNQPHIAQWNLSRFAESLLPLLHEDEDQAVIIAEKAIARFSDIFSDAWLSAMRHKLGLFGAEKDDLILVQDLLKWMQDTNSDYTITFRDLLNDEALRQEHYRTENFQTWYKRWQERLDRNPKPLKSSLCLMRAHNPLIIPRNDHVEDALTAAENGNMKPFHELLLAVQNPFNEDERFKLYRTPPAYSTGCYQTFCGT